MKNWKYIVYKTINLVNNKIYIGLHKTKDPEIFDGYIGNGVYNTQPYTYEHAKTAFQYAVKKYGPKNFRRYTIAVFDTVEEAFQAYKTEKEKYIKEVADKWKNLISDQVYKAMYNYKVEIID